MGFFLSVLGSIFAAAKDLVSKRLAGQLDGTVSTFASFAFALPYYGLVLLILGWLGYEKFEVSLAFLGLVLVRSITDTFAEALKMYALAYGDISIVACFFSLAPLFLLFMSPWITGDRLTWLGTVAVLIVVLGSLLMVYRPSSTNWADQKKGIGLALTAALFFAFNSCFDKLAVQQGTPVFAGFAMTLCSALLLLPLVAFRRDHRAALWSYKGEFALRGLLEILFMVSKLYALQFLQAPEVVAIQRLSLVFSIVGGKLLFHETDFGRRLAAGMLILVGVVLIAWPHD